MTINHTKLPWHMGRNTVVRNTIVYDQEGNAICDCKTFHGKHRESEHSANAEFIQKACNSHYELLNALRGCIASDSPDINLCNGDCRHCGRNYMRDAHALNGLCPEIDCPGHIARKAIQNATK